MNVKDILEAKHIGHSRWEIFKREFLSNSLWPDETKNYLTNDPRFEQVFKEIIWSWEWWHEMARTYMEDDSEEEYDPEELTPEAICNTWIEQIVDDPGTSGALFDLDVFPEVYKDVPSEHMSTITITIARWIKKHVNELDRMS